ncbi:MAG TPA: sialidase family protein, partial [Bacteroidia bacterium]|nr:sialidase family protein [Bacteroidia bacterium]
MKKSLIAIVALCWAVVAFAQPANQNVSGGLIFEGEPFMAINPSNPQHIVVAWIGYVFQQPSGIKSRASFDGGQTWSTTAILPHYRSTYKSADPSLVFDVNGDVLACFVDYRQSPDSGGTFVVRSTDGGLSWGAMSEVIDAYEDGQKLPVDRPWLTIDRSGGAFDGNLYVTTKPAPWVPAPNRPYFMRSTDGGSTWSNWQYIDAAGYLVGNLIAAPMAVSAVTGNGTLHILYPSYVFSQNPLPGYILATSADGGSTFSYQEAWFSLINGNDSLIKGGYQLLSDPSDPDHIALLTPQNLLGDQDVYYVESTDGGANWAAPVRVNDDAPNSGVTQDLVWGGFDQDGDLVLTWRDRRNAGGAGYSVDSEIWGSVWWKDSASFSPNFQISDT